VSVRFYRHDPGDPAPQSALPSGVTVRIWRACDGIPRDGRDAPWWAIERLGLFAQRGFASLAIERDGALLHRLIVTPRWYRFPFMAPEDLQIGGLWTHPAARGQGLARAGVAEAHRRFGDRATRFWYVTEEDNAASIRIAQGVGYRLVGTGERTAPLGIRAMGRYRLTSAA
jgi:RimJ/RimL family protein N-acetyltransferase